MYNSDIIQDFKSLQNAGTDISGHLTTLFLLATECETVLEFGMRKGVSTTALLMAQPKQLTSVDVEIDVAEVLRIGGKAKELNVKYQFFHMDCLDFKCQTPVDLLFCDTYHTYTQQLNELNMFAKHVQKYIAIHDTELFGAIGEDGEPGILFAIRNFVKHHHDWQIFQHYTHNNGLTILKRKNHV